MQNPSTIRNITPLRAFIMLLAACITVLVAMNVAGYLLQRTYRFGDERIRLVEINLDGAQAHGQGRSQVSLAAFPPVWWHEGGGANMVMRRGITNQQSYTLTHPSGTISRVSTLVENNIMNIEYTFTDGTTWAAPPVSLAQYPASNNGATPPNPQHAQERAFMRWMVERYWENPTFTGFMHNIFIGLVFLPLGLALLCFPDTFRKFGVNLTGGEDEPPLSRNKWFRIIGVLVALVVFTANIVLLR